MGYQTAWQEEMLVPQADKTRSLAAVCPERSDQQLVDQIIAGDQTAFEQIFDRHKRLVAAAAARYFSQPHQIEEVIQITFTKAYFELKHFRGGHDLSLAGWLSTIARNICLDLLRSQKRKPEDLVADFFENDGIAVRRLNASANGSEKTVIDRDLAEKLLSSLAADDRALLQMLYVEDMSVRDTSAAMGWTVSKVKVRAWRARNRLRKIVKRFL